MKLLRLRDQSVILDADLAAIYGVSTKRLNEQVRRNKDRFPADFMFQLSKPEALELRKNENQNILYHIGGERDVTRWSQNATTSNKYRRATHQPYAFTEHGALMAATILNSAEAIKMSLFVIRAFVKMREHISTRGDWEKRVLQIENILLSHDDQIRDLYEKIMPILAPPSDPPKKSIGFHVREERARYVVRKKSPRK